MRSAKFLRMVQNQFGVGFLYHLSVPFYGSHHIFVTQDYLVYQCNSKGEPAYPEPWLTHEDGTIFEVLNDLGYQVAA